MYVLIRDAKCISYCGPRSKEFEKYCILGHGDSCVRKREGKRERERENRVEFLFLIPSAADPFEPRYVHVMRKKKK